MAYDEHNAERIRNAFRQRRIDFREIRMMGSWCVMIDEKMCVGLLSDKTSGDPVLMVRIGQEAVPTALLQPHVQATAISDRVMAGYVFVQAAGFDAEIDFAHWLDAALAYNPLAKSSKSRKS